MGRGTVILIALISLSIGVALGVLGITWFVGGSGEPSEPISAPTLSLDPTVDPNAVVTQVASLDSKLNDVLAQLEAEPDSAISEQLNAMATQIAALSNMVSGIEPGVVMITATAVPVEPTLEEPTAVPTVAATEAPAEAQTAAGRALFRIDNEMSEVRFEIDEDLSGLPNHVVGVTNEVAGDIIVDYANPADSVVGTLRINARTFVTDSEFRDRALRSEILESSRDEYEFITFEPTGIRDTPESVEEGDTFTFFVDGNLTIRNITQPVTFEVTVEVFSDTRLNGSATAEVSREDYGLTIPSVPNVANVHDEVLLGFDFVARLVEETA